MAAALGNKNAKGNIGGKSLNDRKLAAEVRSLALTEIREILLGDDNEYKRQIILKLAPAILPRLNEHTGEDGKDLPMTPTVINIIKPDGIELSTQPEAVPGMASSDGQDNE